MYTFTTTTFDLFNDNKNILILLIIIGGFSLLYGLIKEKIIESTSILIMLITCFVLYIYFKKKYSKKIKKLKRQSIKTNMLDLLCNENNNENENICKEYKTARLNYNIIKDLLLKQYSFIS